MDPSSHKSASDSETSKKEKTPKKDLLRQNKRKRDNDNDIAEEMEKFKEEVKSLFCKQEIEFKKILKEIKRSNDNFETSIALLTTQNEELQKRIVTLETKIQEDEKHILLLENKIEDLQMSNRKASFEIKNVPSKQSETKEDLLKMVECLAENVGSCLKKTDIKDIYRVRSKNNSTQNTPIIVETSSTVVKTDVLKMSKHFNKQHKAKLRAAQLGLRTSEDTPIYLSEHLTAKGSRLHFLARDLVKSKKFKFCWTAYGKVYLRKEDNSPVITIKSEAQVQQLMQEK